METFNRFKAYTRGISKKDFQTLAQEIYNAVNNFEIANYNKDNAIEIACYLRGIAEELRNAK